VKTYGRAILSAPAYAMNEEFSRILSQEMDHYSNDPNTDRLNRLKGEMSQVNCTGLYVIFVISFEALAQSIIKVYD
jgi:hypothetical protein